MNDHSQVWARLKSGKGMERMGLPLRDGRLAVPPLSFRASPGKLRAGGLLASVDGAQEIRRAQWENLDFTGSRLPSLRFLGCYLRNCVFDEAICIDWRMWSTSIVDCSFRGTDLRRSALGAVEKDKRNVFSGVRFQASDLRQLASTSAEFRDCSFLNCKLDGIDFDKSTFQNCRFEGHLKDLIFKLGPWHRSSPFKGNDFSRTELEYCEFRGIDLRDTTLPVEGHIVVRELRSRLDAARSYLKGIDDDSARVLLAILDTHRRWAPDGDAIGILRFADLRDAGGIKLATAVAAILANGTSGS